MLGDVGEDAFRSPVRNTHHVTGENVRKGGERDETLAEMALAWILQQKGVTSVLVGASSTAQLEKNMKCVHAKTLNS